MDTILHASVRGLVTAWMVSLATSSGGAILSLSGAFSGDFDPSAPMTNLSGNWTATVDTASASVIGSGTAGTLTSATVSPATFAIAPNPFVMDPAGFSAFASFSTSNVELQAFMLNGVPIGAFLGGSAGGSAIVGVADFIVTYDNQAGGLGQPPQTAPQSVTYLALAAGTSATFSSTNSTGLFTYVESQAVALAPAATAEFLGGQTAGGIGVSFADGYSGAIVVDPFYSNPPESPNFMLALDSAMYWNIEVQSSFMGSAEISFSYDESALSIPESEIAVYHLSDLTGEWEMLPSQVFADQNIVRATTTGFSPFTLGARASNAIPEPASAWLTGLALLGLLAVRSWITRREVVTMRGRT